MKTFITLALAAILAGCGANTTLQGTQERALQLQDETIYQITDTEVEDNETVLYAVINDAYYDFAVADISSEFSECESDITDFDDDMIYVTMICKNDKFE